MTEVVGLVWIKDRGGTVSADWQVINPEPKEQLFIVQVDDHKPITAARVGYGPVSGNIAHKITVTPLNNRFGGGSATYSPEDKGTP